MKWYLVLIQNCPIPHPMANSTQRRTRIQAPIRVVLVCMALDLDIFVQQLGGWVGLAGPLHRRLAVTLEKAIQHGVLLPGTQLPPERKLARALALSRSTVVTAYNTLRAEGWLESRLGSGTWVAAGRAILARQSAHASVLEGSSLFNLLLVNDAEMTDFAVATTKPLSALQDSLFSVSPDVQKALLAERNYVPLGLPILRDAIARYYLQLGIPTDAEQILVTAGAQQAISLVASLYVQRGDTVLVENPTYFGALQAFRLAGARLAALTVGPRHVEPADLRDRILAGGSRLVYLTPTYHNPTGAVMPESARREIAGLSQEFGVPLVEDCTLADIELNGKAPKLVAAFSQNGTVLSVGSMSKLFWAGLRIGWLRASVSVISQLARIKSSADLGSPLLTQVIASQLLSAIDQARILRREQLTSRRDLTAELIRQHLPEWKFTVPSGGLCLWVQLPSCDASHFTQFAARFGVALTPGSIFASEDSYNEFLRIPFLLDEEAITTGLLRLKSAWDEFRATASGEVPRRVTIV
jgi:DNA-binding transcriptional MocR family regulator